MALVKSRALLLAGCALFLCLIAPAARADETNMVIPDPDSIITFQWENASITTSDLPDRYYVNGLRAGYTSPTGDVPDFVANIGHTLWGDGLQRISVNLDQWMYTPAATNIAPPPASDEPYAGVLTADFSLMQDTDDWRSILGVDIGVLGPDAGAGFVQHNFHNLIGQSTPVGWSYQMPNEPILEFISERVWRLPTGHVGGLETDALPNVTAGVGNLWIYGLAGAVFRIGQGLDSDYGVARIRPGMSGGDGFTPVRDFNWYFFAGADAQVFGYNAVLQGEPLQSTPGVSMDPLVGEMEAGFAIILKGVRISYTQVFQTTTFHGEHGGLHQFGSLLAQVRF